MASRKITKSITKIQPRTIGRPAHESATVGRDALIEATCELFRLVPPRMLTRAKIARLTAVDPSLIRYYFKNVHVLLIEAAKLFNRRHLSKVEALYALAGGSPEDRLKARIGALIDLIAEYPYYQRLITEEILESDHPDAVALMKRMTESGIDSYASILEDGIAQGLFRRVDAQLLFMTIVGLADFQMTAHAQINLTDRKSKDGEAFSEVYKQFVCDMVLRSLRP